MSEFTLVEKPLLTQLKSIGWKVFELGEGIPQDPATSLRDNFRQVVLKDVFKSAINNLNIVEDGKYKGEHWLTEEQLESLYKAFTDFGTDKLLAANQEFLQRLKHFQLEKNHLTGEANPTVKIIDFENWQTNRFDAINQFRVDTHSKKNIRPDVVLFVNGLPLVVIECKAQNANCASPMYEGIEQLRRYADIRQPANAKEREGEPKLFYTNQLMISTYGKGCKYGTITSDEQHYFDWKCIDSFSKHQATEPYQSPEIIKHRAQETLVQGMLHPERLLDITRNFTLFMGVAEKQIKVICRYQQYRAVNKVLARMQAGETGIERSGVVWHTQGSGKSLTMVFLVRKLRTLPKLQQYKILMVNDRRDLEAQLTQTAQLTDDNIVTIQTREAAEAKLANASSNLNMVMIHKFREDIAKTLPSSVRKKLEQLEQDNEYDPELEVKLFGQFEEINPSEDILILVDEAHRTQRSGKNKPSLSDNLMDAFPNATRIAFTGTPLIADHHTEPTWKRFGVDKNSAYIDKYKIKDAVADGATLPIVYQGKTADVALNEKDEFDRKFEDLVKDRSEAEMLEIRRRYGAEGDILEAQERINEISKDIVKHYISQILPGGFKAQVVCSSKQAAIYYQRCIDEVLQQEFVIQHLKGSVDIELPPLQTAVIISSGGSTEKADFVSARRRSAELNAIENFKRPFDKNQPETGICILIVCDMLLTGFDAPVEQVMYIDKKVKEHNLLQTIARVNRTYPNKSHGFIVDYIGLTNYLNEALALYNGEDQQDIKDKLTRIEDEEPILTGRYQRLLQLFEDQGVDEIELLVNQKLPPDEHYQVQVKAVDALKDIRQRDSFHVFFKKFLSSMEVVLPNRMADKFKIPMYQFTHIQHLAKMRYYDETMDLEGVGAKVRQLTNEHLISLGISTKVELVDLIRDDFEEHLNRGLQAEDAASKASEMEHAIRKHLNVNMDSDPVFYKRMSDKLQEVIRKHADNWEQLVIQLGELRVEILQGRGPNAAIDDPIFDLISEIAFKEGGLIEHKDKVREISQGIIHDLEQHDGLNFWAREELVKKLRRKIRKRFILSKVEQLKENKEQLTTDVLSLVKEQEAKIREFMNRPEVEASEINWDKLKTNINGTDLYFIDELAKEVPYISVGQLRIKTDIEYEAEGHSSVLVPTKFAQYGIHNEKVLQGCSDLIQLCNEHLVVGEQVGVEQIKELDGRPVKLVWAINRASKGSTITDVELIVIGLTSLSAYPGAVLLAQHIWGTLQLSVKTLKSYLPALKENQATKRRIEPYLGDHYDILKIEDNIDTNLSWQESYDMAVRESKARYRVRQLDDGSYDFKYLEGKTGLPSKSIGSVPGITKLLNDKR